jgi:16S rRNA (guanine527-N7)-methyltransferase
MNTARIAELLEPFLRARPGSNALPNSSPSTKGAPGHFHLEPTKAAEAYPQPDPKPALGPPKEEPAILSPTQLQYISTYIDILIRWNARINLTAIRDPEEIVNRHFGESLFAASNLFPVPASVSPVVKAADATIDAHPDRKEASAPANVLNENLFVSGRSTLADIGSGAGFPGLPIRLWAPQVSLTLVESNHKKAAFLREITRSLTLTNVNIQNARAETLIANTFDVVTLRAVERFESILPTAAALVARAGRLALLIGASQQDQAQTRLPAFTWSEPIPIPHSRNRALLVGEPNS